MAMTKEEMKLDNEVFERRSNYRSIFARYFSRCHECEGHVSNGTRIVSMECGWVHAKCADNIIRARIEDENKHAEYEYDEGAVLSGRADQSRMDAEYAQGYAEGQQYSSDVKTYGRDLADQWEMEAEQGRYDRGEVG